MHRLYESALTVNDVESELLSFVPKIHEFVCRYVFQTQTAQKVVVNRDNWVGRITSIDDIEENLWCPQLGLKGKVDVSVRTATNLTLPLELKTGRASCSLEHRGQVMLYVMMLNKFGYKAQSGLLLYLR